MMGHRSQLISGDEYDTLTKARKYHTYKSGEVKQIKRQHNKRTRKQAKINAQLASRT